MPALRVEPDRLAAVVGDQRAGLLLVALGLRAQEQEAGRLAGERGVDVHERRREVGARVELARLLGRDVLQDQVLDRHPLGHAGGPEREISLARTANRQIGPHGDPLALAELAGEHEARALAVRVRAQPAAVAAALGARHADAAEPARRRAAQRDLRARAGGNGARRGVGADRPGQLGVRAGLGLGGGGHGDEGEQRQEDGPENESRHRRSLQQISGPWVAVQPPSGPIGWRQTSPVQLRRRTSSRCRERRICR